MQTARGVIRTEFLRTWHFELRTSNFEVCILPFEFCISSISSFGPIRATHGGVAAESAQDIRDRSFRYACDIGRLALGVASRPGVRPIADQLLKAGTSVGANLEEAKAASSRREFVRYVEIALREARESAYWLRICRALELEPEAEIETLRNEGEQIARILGSIVVKSKGRDA